jgi:signal transduction histidine kinase
MRVMKKGLIAGVIFGVLFMSLIGFASAVSAGETLGTAVNDFVQGISKALEPVLRYTLGGENLAADVFLVKVLIFILMLSVLYFAVGKVPIFEDNIYLRWIITIVMAILGARFLTPDALINFVWLPNGVVGVALASLLPFIVFFFFIESFSGPAYRLIRKVGWALVTVLFIGLAITRWDDFALSSTSEGIITLGFNLAWLYVITAILAALAFLFDKPIQKKKEEGDKKKRQAVKTVFVEHELAKRRGILVEDLKNAATSQERKRIGDMIKELDKNAREISRLGST